MLVYMDKCIYICALFTTKFAIMAVKEIIHARMPLQEKADKIFGAKDSEAKKVFFKLMLFDGGIEPAVELLSKQKEYANYQKKFNAAVDADDNQKAVMLLQNFRSKLTFELALKFKI